MALESYRRAVEELKQMQAGESGKAGGERVLLCFAHDASPLPLLLTDLPSPLLSISVVSPRRRHALSPPF